jgi:hypothetical protein
MSFEASRESQFSEKGFKWSVWWTSNKLLLKKAFAVLLGLVGFSLLGYGVYGFADYYFLSGKIERLNLAEQSLPYIDYAFHRRAHEPQSLIFEKYAAVPGTSGSYDMAATVTNTNPEWVARFSYSFRHAGEDTRENEVFVLPGDTVWLDALNVKSNVNPGVPEIVTGPISWQRVDFHDTRPDYESWARQRLSIVASEAEYLPSDPNNPLTTSRARFRLDNNTAFGYHDVGLSVVLWSGTRLVGISRMVVSDVAAGERRKDVEAIWFHDVQGVTSVQVDPIIDIFDERVYITPEQL